MNSPATRFQSTPHRPWHKAPARRLALVGLCALSLSGCARWDVREAWPWSDAEEAVLPDRIVPMWTDTILYQPGHTGVRGFGARLYFYNRESKEPVEVDGKVIVYAFDAEKPQSGIPIPEKKFVFTADQLPLHHSQTSLGHSYSLWLPWDEVGGATRQISLITRYEGRAGGVIVSDPSRKLLPGITPTGESSPAEANGSAVQAASFETETRQSGERPESITIDVSPDFARKLAPVPQKPDAPSWDESQTTPRSAPAAAPAAPERVEPAAPASSSVDPTQLSDPPVSGAVGGQTRMPYHDRLSAHFSQSRYPARNWPESKPPDGLPRKQPYRAKWLSALPPTPRPHSP